MWCRVAIDLGGYEEAEFMELVTPPGEGDVIDTSHGAAQVTLVIAVPVEEASGRTRVRRLRDDHLVSLATVA